MFTWTVREKRAGPGRPITEAKPAVRSVAARMLGKASPREVNGACADALHILIGNGSTTRDQVVTIDNVYRG